MVAIERRHDVRTARVGSQLAIRARALKKTPVRMSLPGSAPELR